MLDIPPGRLIDVDQLPCGFLITTNDRKIIFANRYFEENLGGKGLEGNCLNALLTKASQLFCDTYVVPTVFRDGRCCEVLLTLRSDHGHAIPKIANVQQLADGCFSWVFVEAQNRAKLFNELEAARCAVEEQREELELLSRTDALTGLANRRGFDEALHRIFTNADRSERPAAVMMLDFDNFKTINDRYGHDVGDDALRVLADVLRTTSRKTDTIARFGGDEFACILPNSDEYDAKELCRRLHKALSELAFECSMTVSIGVSVRPAGALITAADALKRADQALYAAKQAGRDTTSVWGSWPRSDVAAQRNSPAFNRLAT